MLISDSTCCHQRKVPSTRGDVLPLQAVLQVCRILMLFLILFWLSGNVIMINLDIAWMILLRLNLKLSQSLHDNYYDRCSTVLARENIYLYFCYF